MEREPLMAIIHSYFDESGKFKDRSVVSFCGVVASPARIASFNEEWQECLRQSRIPFLTMKDAVRFNTPLSKSNPALGIKKRTAVLSKFARIVIAHFETALAAAVDVKAHQSEKAIQKNLGEDPHYTAFLRVLLQLLDYANEEDKISFVCDDDESTALPCYHYYRKVKSVWPMAKQKLASLCFADDTLVPSLQAADMLSSLVRLEAEKRFHQVEYDFGTIYAILSATPKGNQRMKPQLGFWGREELEDLAANYEKMTP